MEKRPKKKLLDQVRDVIRLKHYSIRTEKAYVSWIRRYILFHNKRHPREMGSREMLWKGSILTPAENGVGNTFFPQNRFPRTREAAKCAAIISMRAACEGL